MCLCCSATLTWADSELIRGIVLKFNNACIKGLANMNRFINRSLQSAITCSYVFIELTNMTKFYEVSKVLDKHTDAHGHVQFLVRWRGYGRRYDSLVDEHNTNECFRHIYCTRHQGNLGLLQTLDVLIAEKLNMKKPPTTSIVRRVSITMPMDSKTFQELFSGLPSAKNLLQVTTFSVPVHELDTIMPPGWSLNTFKTSTTCRLQPGKPVEIALLERKKVFYIHTV